MPVMLQNEAITLHLIPSCIETGLLRNRISNQKRTGENSPSILCSLTPRALCFGIFLCSFEMLERNGIWRKQALCRLSSCFFGLSHWYLHSINCFTSSQRRSALYSICISLLKFSDKANLLYRHSSGSWNSGRSSPIFKYLKLKKKKVLSRVILANSSWPVNN